ncbi:hypothetical protein Acr_01g0000790 [Actinidia rufa]|uniref:Uncharacterized protein n=1 Tax=Actinidia rufa TaxID=165716 RepID=A0A7J0E1J4_9ERIC|nr:hypothetical protein Acr_01g0000790 [Actinidia rufa]
MRRLCDGQNRTVTDAIVCEFEAVVVRLAAAVGVVRIDRWLCDSTAATNIFASLGRVWVLGLLGLVVTCGRLLLLLWWGVGACGELDRESCSWPW